MNKRALLLIGPRELAWVSEELPALQPDEILVQTRAGAISTGSELPLYCGTARQVSAPTYPRMTGYENVGIVVACGPEVRRLQVGARVVASYGHQTHAIIPEAKAIVTPDHISEAQALLAILSCDVAKGIRKAAINYDEAVLVTGAGAIGLLTIFMLKALGIQLIDVVEPLEARRALALRLGAATVLRPQEMNEHKRQYTVAFECSSRNAAFELIQTKMQPEGRICILADGNLEPLVLSPEFHAKELRVIGSSDGWDYQAHAAWYFSLLGQGSYPVELLFDYRIGQDELPDTFERLASGAITPLKVFVRYE